jgi:predicted murein hydrolase (TIGR00659 family)
LTDIVLRSALAIGVTMGLYWAALRLQGRYAWANPLITTTGAVIAVLFALRIPYERYREGSALLTYLLGPATVALGVPMYRQGLKLKRMLGRLALVVLAGSVVGMATAGGVAWMMGAPRNVVASAIPKSVTTPIAVEVCEELHGNPAITVAMVLITGLLGSAVGPGVLRLVSIRHDHAVGAAVGASSHAIGTAALIRRFEDQGSVSSIAMVMAGIFTSVLAMVLSFFWA